MSQIDNIVRVNISRNTTQINIDAFDIPLLLVPMTDQDTSFTDRVRTYTDVQGVADDLGVNHIGYLMAQKLMGGALKPATFKIGKVNTQAGAVETYVEALAKVQELDDTWYAVMAASHLDEDIMSLAQFVQPQRKMYFTSTADQKAKSLEQTVVYTAEYEFPAATFKDGDRHTLTIAGEKFISTYDEDTATWSAWDFAGTNPQFQGQFNQVGNKLTVTNGDLAFTITRITQILEGTETVFTNLPKTDPKGMDIGQRLKFMGFDRTEIMFSDTADAEFPECAWVGPQIVEVPGSNTWEYKSLAGVTKSNFSDSVISLLESRGYNYYIEIKGANVTRRGKVAQGEWIDVMILVDWLHSRIQEQIFFRLINSRKIPYTDAGAVIIENEIRSVLAQAVANNGIDQYTVQSPRVLSIPEMQRASRTMGDFTFDARLAGAVSVVVIRGVVHA